MYGRELQNSMVFGGFDNVYVTVWLYVGVIREHAPAAIYRERGRVVLGMTLSEGLRF
jgi:hypothetical protein